MTKQENKQEISLIKSRILEYLDFKGLSHYSFYKDAGVTRGVLTQPNGLSEENLHKFLAYAQDISPLWLLTGQGDMFFKENVHPIIKRKMSTQNVDMSTQLVHPIPEIDRGVKRIDREAFAESPSGGIPLIPIDAAAGFLSGVGAQIMDYECERYQIPGFKGAEFLIRVSGDSMTPKYESGDIVACQRLETDTFLQWNKVYVVDSEQGVLVKRIKPGRADDTLTLVSDNAEYAPFEIERRQVYGLGRVVGLIRIE